LAAAQRTDVVLLTNGDHVTGEIKKLYEGLLEVKTDHMGTVQIEWPFVEEVTSQTDFEVVLEDGQRLYGPLRPAAEKGEIEVRGVEAETVALAVVVDLAPLKKSFLDQLAGSASVGFSFSQSNTVTTWTGSAMVSYLTRKHLATLSLSSYLNSQQDTDPTTRNVVGFSFARFLANRWSVIQLTDFLQSDELGVDLRTTLGGAVGRSIVRSNRNVLTPIAGVVYSNSLFTGSTPSRNEMLAITGLRYSLFTFGAHKTTFTTFFSFLPSLTESGHLRLDLESRLRIKLFSDFYWSLDLYENFDNDPPLGGAQSDFGLSTSLGWTF
jgi:hypothetical protein